MCSRQMSETLEYLPCLAEETQTIVILLSTTPYQYSLSILGQETISEYNTVAMARTGLLLRAEGISFQVGPRLP